MSKSTPTKRKLAAIICMDLVAYSRHMKTDEEGTLQRLKACRKELLDPEIADFGGRVVKTIGDGLLLEFSSIVDAVRCAVNIQRGMSERNEGLPPDDRMEFRIGINLCDVIIDEDDIFGDGVNITARIEKITDPGGICVSGAVYEDVVDKLDELWFEDMNQLSFKNIDRPVRVLRLRWQGQKPDADRKPAEGGPARQPSVAVLPFVEPPQADARPHLAAGLVADISRALARQPGL